MMNLALCSCNKIWAYFLRKYAENDLKWIIESWGTYSFLAYIVLLCLEESYIGLSKGFSNTGT